MEPHPGLVEIGLELMRSNKLPFKIHPWAAGDKQEQATLYLSAKSESSNSLQEGIRRSLGEVQVKVVPLRKIVDLDEPQQLILKIDTETTEHDVLRGARDVITRHRPWIICEVLYSCVEKGIIEAMEGHGYTYYMLSEDGNETLIPREEILGDPEYVMRDWCSRQKQSILRLSCSIRNGCTPLAPQQNRSESCICARARLGKP